MGGVYPSVSIIMPIYAGDSYLIPAIRSILNQTYIDFELIIIYDTPSESTLVVLNQFANEDPRIRLVRGEERGLVASLNLGLSIARGRYFARMDGDDIAHPNRLKKQVSYMANHPDCQIVSCFIDLIDESGNRIGEWPADRESVTPGEIRNRLISENCVAHPTILAKREVFTEYEYRESQATLEDYDLWMNFCSDGNEIHKIPEALLQYRLHSASITAQSNKSDGPWKDLSGKREYLIYRIRERKLNVYDVKIATMALFNLFIYLKSNFRERTESQDK